MLPSNLNLNIEKTIGYSNKFLITDIDMKIGSNKDINKLKFATKNLPQAPPKSNNSHGAAHLMHSSDKQMKKTDNQKCLLINVTRKNSRYTFDRGK